MPAAWLAPRTTQDVREIVLAARSTQTKVVPVGHGSAYWRPLDLRDAYALDLRGLNWATLPSEASFASFGAGTLVNEVDAALHSVGSYLPLHPDAFGTTTLGALVAVGSLAGIGMASADIDQLVSGLTLVLGTGEILKTGASHIVGSSPYSRPGLPDPTGLFVGSQGSLGIVTEVHLHRRRRPHVARVHGRVSIGAAPPDWTSHVARIAQQAEGLYDTFRVVQVHEGPGAGLYVDLYVLSSLNTDELRVRADHLKVELESALHGISLQVDEMDSAMPLSRFRGPVDGLEHLFRTEHLAAVDVIVPYPALADCLAAAETVMAEARELGAHARTALYLAPGFVNLGLHIPLEIAKREDAGDHVRRWAKLYAGLPVTPYRWGGVWAPLFRSRLAPGYEELIRAISTVMDPDGILTGGPSSIA